MKTFKSYILVAVAVLTIATLTACSNEDLAFSETPTQKNNEVTLTAILSPQNGTGTRSTMDDNGTKIVTAWEVGDKIWVNYDDAHTGTGTL